MQTPLATSLKKGIRPRLITPNTLESTVVFYYCQKNNGFSNETK